MGDKTICRYENGSIQDKAHNSLLLFLREPENMRIYLTENEIKLDERQKAKLLDIVNKLEFDSGFRVEKRFWDRLFQKFHVRKMDLKDLIMRSYVGWFCFFT